MVLDVARLLIKLYHSSYISPASKGVFVALHAYLVRPSLVFGKMGSKFPGPEVREVHAANKVMLLQNDFIPKVPEIDYNYVNLVIQVYGTIKHLSEKRTPSHLPMDSPMVPLEEESHDYQL